MARQVGIGISWPPVLPAEWRAGDGSLPPLDDGTMVGTHRAGGFPRIKAIECYKMRRGDGSGGGGGMFWWMTKVGGRRRRRWWWRVTGRADGRGTPPNRPSSHPPPPTNQDLADGPSRRGRPGLRVPLGDTYMYLPTYIQCCRGGEAVGSADAVPWVVVWSSS